MKFITGISFLLLIIWQSGCSSYKKNSNSFAKQCVYLDSLDFFDIYSADQFDSLADQLALDGQSEFSANTRLYALRENNYQSKNEPRNEKKLSNLLTEARRKGWMYIEAEAEALTGENYWHAKADKKNGLMHYFKAYELYKNFSPQEFPHKLKHLYNYAGAYNMFEDHEAAANYFLQAIGIGDYYDKGLLISTYNSLGICYKQQNKLDSAIYYLKQGLQIAQQYQRKIWVDIIEGNLGAIYFLQNSFAEAQPLLLKDVARGSQGKDWRSAASSLLYLSQIEQKKGNMPLAMQHAQLARNYIGNIASKEFNILLRSYNQLSALYAGEKNFEAAYRYNDSAKQMQDTLQQLFGKTMFLRAQQKMDEEKYTSDFKVAVQRNKYLRNILIIAIVLLMVIALLVLGRQKMKQQQKQRQHDNERQAMQRELEMATAQLKDYTRHIEEKNELIEKFKSKASQNIQIQPDAESVSHLERLVILTDEQWDEFTLLFEKVHGNFFKRLKEKIPGLSPADTRFMALSKLQLSTKAMANMLGITPNGVRMSKYRIIKKLNLEQDEELEKLIQDI